MMKIPKVIVVLGIIIAALLLTSYKKFPTNLKIYKTIEGAEKKAADGYIYSTLLKLDEIAQQESSKRVPIKMVQIAMEYGYYEFAEYAMETYLIGEWIPVTEADMLNNYTDERQRYYDTCNACQDIIDNADYTNKDVENEIMVQISNLLENPQYDTATLYYYIGSMTSDESVRSSYYEACYNMNPNYIWAAVDAAESYRRAGDIKKARELLMIAHERDKEDAATLCGLAIAEALEGDFSKGLSHAKEAYQIYAEGDCVAETYIVFLAASGDKKSAQSIKDSLEQEGYYFEDKVQEFLNGKVTFIEYYMDEI